MISFLAPNVPARAPRPGERQVHALPELTAALHSRHPEHANTRAQVVALNQQAMAIARSFAVALPDELQEFWEAYAGWFAMYSVGPLLANMAVARHVLADTGPQPARIIERWRGRAWWSGRENLVAAIADVWTQAGGTLRVHPGPLLRALRHLIAPRLAARQGASELRRLAAAAARDPLPTPEPCEALFLAVGASSADMIVRLQRALAAAGLRVGVVDYDYFGSRAALERAGIPFAPLTGFLGSEDFAAPPASARPDTSDLPAVEELTTRQRDALVARLRLVLARDATPWSLMSRASHRALEAFAPKVVVGFHTYGPVMAPTIIAAQHRGLPRLCLQHGVIGPRYLALPCLPYDEKLVFGEYARNIMAQPCPDLCLTVTGHVLHDETLTPPTPSQQVMALREGVSGLVLLCTQFNEPAYYQPGRWWMAGVAEACRRLGARLVVKLHPSDTEINVRLYRRLVAEDDDRVVLIPHGQHPLNELLVACDLMVTRDSTVVFEANQFDRPAVTINLSDHDEELPYAGTGGAIGVTRYEDIGPAIEGVLRDESVRQALAEQRPGFLAQHTGPRDGQATARIAGIIQEWAEGRRQTRSKG